MARCRFNAGVLQVTSMRALLVQPCKHQSPRRVPNNVEIPRQLVYLVWHYSLEWNQLISSKFNFLLAISVSRLSGSLHNQLWTSATMSHNRSIKGSSWKGDSTTLSSSSYTLFRKVFIRPNWTCPECIHYYFLGSLHQHSRQLQSLKINHWLGHDSCH